MTSQPFSHKVLLEGPLILQALCKEVLAVVEHLASFSEVAAYAVCPWLVIGSRALPGIAQEDVQEMHRSEWWWSPGASGQSCMQKVFLTYLGLKLVFSVSAFELLLENVPGEMNC